MKKALYPGSFDPVTNGHLDIVRRARKLFEELVITVAVQREKEPLFSLEERMDMIRKSVDRYENVTVTSTDKLIVEYAREVGARALIRGLRFVSDIEYEFQMAWMNRHLNEEVITVFLMTDARYTHLNSTLIKEVFGLGGDIGDFVPDHVVDRLDHKLGTQR